MSTSIDDTFRTALAHYQAGEWVSASRVCRQILDQNPSHAPALHLLGILARRGGNPQLSASLLRLALVNRPSEVSYHQDLGITLMELGQADEAAAAFSQAIRIRPDRVEPRLGLAAALRGLGRFNDAIVCYQQLLAIRPDLVQAQIELGHLLLRTGQMPAAITCYRRVIELAPGHLDAQNSLGNALTALEEFEEAEQVFRSALRLDPNSGQVWNNLGNLFHVQAKADEAMDAYQHAVATNSNLAAAHSNLGNLLKDQGKLPQAIAALRRAVELDPASPTLHSNLVYSLLFDPDQDAEQILNESRRWADRFESPLLAGHRPFDNDPDPGRRLRVGYISADFRSHVIGRNVLPILENHNHAEFEIHCFSTHAVHDAQTAGFIRAADRWHECAAMTDEQLAEKVRAERIDILVDLSLHLSQNRLLTFARKPAPVQVTWAGYPGTTGLRSIDYRITDPHLDPPGENDRFYTEQSIRLPHSFWCYRAMNGTPDVNPLPALSNGCITFGCLNNPSKVNAVSLELWSAVLRQVPRSRLVLVIPTGSRRSEIQAVFSTRQIDPNRLQFVDPCQPHEHLIRYHLIDISLDPLPYTGHTSTLDSLWMGVPVVTLAGRTCVSRGSVTALLNLNLPELIAGNFSDYVQIAARLAGDVSTLSQLRQCLRDQMECSPLCAEKRFTSDLETAWKTMWHTYVELARSQRQPGEKNSSP